MQGERGTFIVIEGTDGSGKGTQFKLLVEHLERAGYDVATFDFPQYDSPSSYFVRKYLNGEYGEAADVGPYTASLFYALDRFEASAKIREALAQGKIVVSNRFTGSSMGHQGTMFRNAEERRGYFIWLDNLEFEMLRIPRPDTSIVLRVPAEISQALVDQKAARSYTDKKRDLLEADLTHLQRAVEVYDDLTQLFPKDFMRLDCVRDGELMSIADVEKLVWQKIEPLLPPPSLAPKVRASKAAATAGPAIADEPTQASTTKEEMDDNLRDAFATAAEKDKELAGTDITTEREAAGRQKPRGFMVTLGAASDLLAASLQQAGLEVSADTTTMRLEQKDAAGRYAYFTPEYLPPDVQEVYRAHMDRIFGMYAEALDLLARHLKQASSTPTTERGKGWKKHIYTQARQTARPLLPVATEAAVSMSGTVHAVEQCLPRLLGHTLPEVRAAGEQLLVAARATRPNAAKQNLGDSPAAIAELARTYLPEYHDSPAQMVNLTDVWPRNEFDLVPDMLFEHSSYSLRGLRNEVGLWPYERKADVFHAFTSSRAAQQTGTTLDRVRYTWDLGCDYQTVRDLQTSGAADLLAWQTLTPRYGYAMPTLIEEAGLADLFEACFELSLKLYSQLQQAGFPLEAQYATLFGHRQRATASTSARQALQLHQQGMRPKASAGTQRLARHMHAKIAEVHPLLSEALQK